MAQPFKLDFNSIPGRGDRYIDRETRKIRVQYNVDMHTVHCSVQCAEEKDSFARYKEKESKGAKCIICKFTQI